MEHIVKRPITYTLEDIKKLHWGFNGFDEVCAWGGLEPNSKFKEEDTIILIGDNFKLFSEVIISDDDGVMLNISSKFELDGVKYSVKGNEVHEFVFAPVKCETCVPEDHFYCSKCPTCHKKGDDSESQQETTTS